MFARILVAVDGTPTSNRGLATAVGVAKAHEATLFIVHVLDELVIAPILDGGVSSGAYVDVMLKSLRRRGDRIVADAKKLASKSVPNVNAEIVRNPGQQVASAILAHAKRVRADLIVLGTHGRRGFDRMLMGSDAEAVVREATVPVLLVRSPARTPARPGRRARPATAKAKAREKPAG